MRRGPLSKGFPDNVTGWYDIAGMVTETGFVSNGTPEVLRNSYTFATTLDLV
jgi:hypothetical protein